ncbi:MAG: hypothetical protein MHPSP_001492, partial [Paramarteilia canceri]
IVQVLDLALHSAVESNEKVSELSKHSNNIKSVIELLNSALVKLNILSKIESEDYLVQCIERIRTFLANIVYLAIKKEKNSSGIKEAQSKKLEFENYLFQLVDKANFQYNGLDDLIGLEEAKQILREALVLPKCSPHLFESGLVSQNLTNGSLSDERIQNVFTLVPWSTILMYGPPGSGKTSLVEAVAAESDSLLVKVTCADILSSWFGESEKTEKEDEATRRIKTELLVQFDAILDSNSKKRSTYSQHHTKIGLHNAIECSHSSSISSSSNSSLSVNTAYSTNRVVLICATNCYKQLDKAFLRRFQQKVFIPLPDTESRGYFFENVLHKMNLDSKQNNNVLEQLVNSSEGLSLCDLKHVVTE